MKKTQILSAIALAFALGVVAPIAVAENASAVTEATDSADGTATVADANKFKGSVEGSKQYQALKTLNAEMDKITAAGLAGTEVEATLASSIVTAYGAAVKIDNAASIAGANLSQAISIAKSNVKNYDTWAKAIALINEVTANNVAGNTAKDTLKGYYKTLTGNDYAGADAYADIEAAIKDNTTTGYTAAKAVVDAVVKGENVIKYTTELKTVLESVKVNGVAVPGLTTADTWAKLYTAADAAKAGTQGAAYTALVNSFKTLTNGMNDNEETQKTNFTTLKGLLANVEKLYGVDAGSLTVSQIVNGYNPVVVPDDDDKKDDVDAPATGIAGTAEGTATTVSIVAGLATALTTLGAGVVAYRSARRK